MSKLDGTKTLQNLKKAFFAEAEAHTKYHFYASKANKEGFNIIANFFHEASENEKEHAKLWFKALHNDDIPITKQNLLDAIKGENFEYNLMYENFAKDAESEGFDEIAKLFKMVGNIEKHHCEIYQKLLNQLETNELFNNNEPILWICTNCGHLHFANDAPDSCPVCKHPKAFFVRENRNI